MASLRSLIHEVHRRSLWQVLGIYGIASWIIYQVVLALWEGIGLPSWVPGAALVLLLIGLPIVLATAFVQEGAPGVGDGGEEVGAGSSSGSLAGLETTAEAVSGTGSTVRAGTGGGERIGDTTMGPSGTGSPEGSADGESSSPSRTRDRLFTWPKAITGGILAFATLGLASAGFMGMRALGIGPAATLISSGELSSRDEIVLADFESLSNDSVLSRVVTEAFRADLAQSTAIDLATDNEVGFVLERMGQPAGASLTAELARQVATRGGMKALIAGDIGRLGGQYVLSTRIVGALDGEVLATFRETAADSTELVSAVDRLSKSVREKVGESLRSIRQSPYLMAITTPSLPALRKLTQAQDAANRGDEHRAMVLLEEAIELDPEFSEAHRKRGAIFFNRGRVTEALAAFEKALERPDRLTDYERYHTRALVAEVQGNPTQAISEYQALLEIDSTDTRALNNLGVTYYLMGEMGRSAEAYRRAIAVLESDSTESIFPGTYLGAAGAVWNQGDRDGARDLVDRLEELNPDAAGVWTMRSQYAASAGDYESALESARILRDRFPANRDAPFLSGALEASIYGIRGQVARSTEASLEQVTAGANTAELGWALGNGVRAALLQVAVLGDTASALQILATTRSAAPLDSVPDPPLAGLAVAYAAAGQLDSARVMSARLRDRPDWFHRSYPYLVPAAEAAIAAAEGAYGEAESGWRRADATHDACSICFKARVGLMAELQGDRAGAMEAYDAFLTEQWVVRAGNVRRGYMPSFEGDLLHRAMVLERLAGLHEEAGNPAEAARYYREFVELWEDADPELQPRVDAARRALQRLAAEG